MSPFDAQQLARQLMQQHGLAGWTFAFDHAKRRFGSCRYRSKRITLSKTLTFLNDQEQVRQTLMHEIAHALTPGAGHGPRWRQQCRALGIAPQRCYDEESVAAPPRRAARYVIGCPACDWWRDRHRRPTQRLICRQCRTPIMFREKSAIPPGLS